MVHCFNMDYREFIIGLSALGLAAYILRRFNGIRVRYRDLEVVLLDRIPQRDTEAALDPPNPDPEPPNPAIEN